VRKAKDAHQRDAYRFEILSDGPVVQLTTPQLINARKTLQEFATAPIVPKMPPKWGGRSTRLDDFVAPVIEEGKGGRRE